MSSIQRPLFSLGNVVLTQGAIAALQNVNADVCDFLQRHIAGDFGNICADDAELNNQAITEGSRILSSYLLGNKTTIWIITEADRSSTCILLPDEY